MEVGLYFTYYSWLKTGCHVSELPISGSQSHEVETLPTLSGSRLFPCGHPRSELDLYVGWHAGMFHP